MCTQCNVVFTISVQIDNNDAVLRVPREWADELKRIAKAEDPKKKWSAKARQVLRGYLDMRAANADLMGKAAQPQTGGC